MTEKRGFKAEVRARAKKTGESYTAARAKMLEGKEPKAVLAETPSYTETVLDVKYERFPRADGLEHCDTQYGECVLPKGHRSDEHGDDHQDTKGTWWNVGKTMTDPPKLSATDLMRKAFAAWGITIGEGGKLTAPDGRELKAKWSPESAENIVQDLKAFHGIDGEVELARAVMDAVFVSLFGKDAEQPKSPELLWKGIGANNAVFLTDFDREVMRDTLEYKPTPAEQRVLDAKLTAGPAPADLWKRMELSDEEKARLAEAAAKEPDCTCGEELGANADCRFHHPPIVEASATTPENPIAYRESIDVAQKLVNQAIADHAGGVRGIMTIDTGDMTPEQALRVVTATKTQYRAALGKPPLDGKGLCLLCEKAPSHCECEGSKPPWGKLGLCVMCGRNVTCACPVDPAGTTYARCTNASCGKVYRVGLTQSRRCEHCGHTPVEVIDPDARTFTTKGGFLTVKEPTAAELFSDDPNHEEDTACSCGGVNRIGPPEPGDPEKVQHDDPDCLFHHPLTSRDSVLRRDEDFVIPARCSARSSVTDQRCTLKEGHAADSATRFHRFGPTQAAAEALEAAVKAAPTAHTVQMLTDKAGNPVMANIGLPMIVTPALDPETEAVREAQATTLDALPPIPAKDLVPVLEALKYINSGDAHPDEAREEAREVLEDFDKKHPNVLTALMDPREDSDADPEAVVVVVNGRPINVVEKTLDYRAVVALAKYDPERVLSVTYRAKSGKWKREGTLSKGQSVEVLPGMVFNVADTSNA